MFRKNKQRQASLLFGPEMVLSEPVLAQLKQSWAQTFREEVFERIDEEIFAPLYSEKDSRPNAPVNVLMGFEIIKAGQGWSDEELYEALLFDIRMRYALGIEEAGSAPPFTLRTVYNFRRRVQKYAQETGKNLYEKVFEQVTDEHLQRYQVAARLQRQDSTQVLSNVAQMNRLTLLIGVLQVGIKGVPEAEQAHWREEAQDYVQKRAHEVAFGIRREDAPQHFERLGVLLLALREALASESAAYQMVQRALTEHYKEEEGVWQLREAGEISADSLQSPYDEEATYRVKNGNQYPGGYVVNVSETCEPENALQLITDIRVAANVTDDSKLLQETLTNQMERGIDVEEVVTDGGYTSPETTDFCAAHDIIHRPTTVRGGKGSADKLGWKDYEWRLENKIVICPQGQQGKLEPGRKGDKWFVRFPDTEQCQTCPLLASCRVVLRKQLGPTLYVTTRNIEVALIRQGLRPEDHSLRSAVEGTVRTLKWHLRKDKLPVRGLTAARMYFSAVAAMVNLRRIHAWLSSITTKFDAATAVFSYLGLF